ncbi:hypothetical protein PPERSA_00197 [Pseudocohnilembus persalinus]|uniref:Uncharacterized protein n=1 Tax=Pseudocohnilembus persalinus TaxID=266149 RepID=A0A0V0QQF0_PSEPJ|nr:hypothetical protein PPERSA_00197 [Pseudocohnilembus persalinus]|eukprot:KRX04428.1 hypothetical protein PPERSA_00197 [Pseudocohnilembus persalinus]
MKFISLLILIISIYFSQQGLIKDIYCDIEWILDNDMCDNKFPAKLVQQDCDIDNTQDINTKTEWECFFNVMCAHQANSSFKGWTLGALRLVYQPILTLKYDKNFDGHFSAIELGCTASSYP